MSHVVSWLSGASNYNHVRPHSSLDDLTPFEYERRLSSVSPLRGSPPESLPIPDMPATTGPNQTQHPAEHQL